MWMKDDKLRPCYTMAMVRNLTGLTDRQIRYYEEVGLISPLRSRGKQRIFTPAEVERLNIIKERIAQGLTIEVVKGEFALKDQPSLSYTPVEPARTLPGITRGLTSLYPVSNRAQLVQIIVQRRREQAKAQKENKNNQKE